MKALWGRLVLRFKIVNGLRRYENVTVLKLKLLLMMVESGIKPRTGICHSVGLTGYDRGIV